MSWALSENAKKVRRIVYEQFLEKGASDGVGKLLEQSGLSPEALETTMDELERALMVMCAPGTRDVAKCPPWSNIPTRHGIELGGKHVCHAGCLFEAMNISYCYPEQTVTIRSACPQTGQEIVVRLEGNDQIEVSPPTTVGHVGVDPADWTNNWFHACANNNFFVSPEAVAQWEKAHPEHRGVILTMDQLKAFANYRNRLDYERGADPNNIRSGDQMFGRLGVQAPPNWK